MLTNDVCDRESTTAESGEEKVFAWDHCLTAAQHLVEISEFSYLSGIYRYMTLSTLAKVWNVNFFFRHASPFYVYDVFQAGLIWVAAGKHASIVISDQVLIEHRGQ